MTRSIHLRHSSDLLHRHVEQEQVERFAAHSRQVADAHGILVNEGQVTIHPHLPLWLWAQLVQSSYLFVGGCGRVGLLLEGNENNVKQNNNKKIKTNVIQIICVCVYV